MKKIKILFAIDSLDVGGAEKLFIDLVKRINREKYDISICLTVERGIWFDSIVKQGFNVKVLNKKGKFDITIISKIVKLIKKEKPDIIHGWLYYSTGMILLASLFTRNNYKKICGVYGFPLKWNFYYFLIKFFKNYIDKYSAVSGYVRERLIRDGFPPDRITVIYNGIDFSEPELKVSEGFKKKKNSYTIGAVGSLEPIKGHRYFLQSMPLIRKEVNNAKFLLAGQGSLEEELRSLASNLEIEDCLTFVSFRKSVYEIMQQLDILVMPSLLEALPNVLIEGMALGKPVVATNVGGIPEIVEDEVTGILVAPKDPERMADAILQLLRDESLRRKMGEAGRRKVEMLFNVDQMVKKTEEIYDKILKD